MNKSIQELMDLMEFMDIFVDAKGFVGHTTSYLKGQMLKEENISLDEDEDEYAVFLTKKYFPIAYSNYLLETYNINPSVLKSAKDYTTNEILKEYDRQDIFYIPGEIEDLKNCDFKELGLLIVNIVRKNRRNEIFHMASDMTWNYIKKSPDFDDKAIFDSFEKEKIKEKIKKLHKKTKN